MEAINTPSTPMEAINTAPSHQEREKGGVGSHHTVNSTSHRSSRRKARSLVRGPGLFPSTSMSLAFPHMCYITWAHTGYVSLLHACPDCSCGPPGPWHVRAPPPGTAGSSQHTDTVTLARVTATDISVFHAPWGLPRLLQRLAGVRSFSCSREGEHGGTPGGPSGPVPGCSPRDCRQAAQRHGGGEIVKEGAADVGWGVSLSPAYHIPTPPFS